MIDLHTGASYLHSWANGAILAEFGSIQLEFKYLSDLTGDPKYAKSAFRIMDYVTSREKPISGLYPTAINNNDGNWINGPYTVGALADSFYEYLLKIWLISDKESVRYRELWEESAAAIKERLVSTSESGSVYTGIGGEGYLSDDMEHLVLKLLINVWLIELGLFRWRNVCTRCDDEERGSLGRMASPRSRSDRNLLQYVCKTAYRFTGTLLNS